MLSFVVETAMREGRWISGSHRRITATANGRSPAVRKHGHLPS